MVPDLLLLSVRILYEFSSSDDPAWSYFDAQHKHIMQNMRDVYTTAVSTIKGQPSELCWSDLMTHVPVALNDKTPVEGPDQNSLNRELASQLQTCVQAIEAKQQDVAIGTVQSTTA